MWSCTSYWLLWKLPSTTMMTKFMVSCIRFLNSKLHFRFWKLFWILSKIFCKKNFTLSFWFIKFYCFYPYDMHVLLTWNIPKIKCLCRFQVSYIWDSIFSLHKVMIYVGLWYCLKTAQSMSFLKCLIVQFRKKHLRKSSLISMPNVK